MCCVSYGHEVAKFLSKHKNHKQVMVYKILKLKSYYFDEKKQATVVQDCLESPFMYFLYKKPKEYTCGRKEQKKNRLKDRHVGQGFHCYLSLEEAENQKDPGEVIVAFYVNPDDVIGVECYNGHAVFTKATLKEKDYENALAGGPCLKRVRKPKRKSRSR